MNSDEIKTMLEAAAKAVEGLPEQLQPAGFVEAVRLLEGTETSPMRSNRRASTKKARGAANAEGQSKTSKRSRARVASPSLDRELNLRQSGKQTLREFFKEKQPSGQNETNLALVYYLQHIAEVSANVNRVYTSYKDVGVKIPAILRNSLQVTSSREGWINTGDMDNISTTPGGENVVEHDLPRAEKKKQ